MTGCILRHKRSLKGKAMVRLTVLPDDGRDAEEFYVSESEIRRFAWSLLADYDPEEAQACAGERGPVVVQFAERPRRAPRNLVRRTHEIAALSDYHMALDALRDGPGYANAVTLPREPRDGRHRVFHQLGKWGHVERLNKGKQGVPGLWKLTTHGEATLADLPPFHILTPSRSAA